MTGILHTIDDFDLARFVPVAAAFGQDRYGFVVTPNVDHLIRCENDRGFREHYAAAAFVLMDSRLASKLLRRLRNIRLPVCTGSDLTAALFQRIITPADRIVVIGGSPAQARFLAERHHLADLRHYNPPMGFIRDPQAVEQCLRFIEASSPFRFCFLAVGSPQQEALAHALKLRGAARGLALCIGASINFLTGSERRAPRWMQRAGLEWLYRLSQNPRRLARRYLVQAPRLVTLLGSRFVLRLPADSARNLP